MPDDFDNDDGGENFCRSYCEGLNEEIRKIPFIKDRDISIEKLLLYKTDCNTGDKDKDKGKEYFVKCYVSIKKVKLQMPQKYLHKAEFWEWHLGRVFEKSVENSNFVF